MACKQRRTCKQRIIIIETLSSVASEWSSSSVCAHKHTHTRIDTRRLQYMFAMVTGGGPCSQSILSSASAVRSKTPRAAWTQPLAIVKLQSADSVEIPRITLQLEDRSVDSQGNASQAVKQSSSLSQQSMP